MGHKPRTTGVPLVGAEIRSLERGRLSSRMRLCSAKAPHPYSPRHAPRFAGQISAAANLETGGRRGRAIPGAGRLPPPATPAFRYRTKRSRKGCRGGWRVRVGRFWRAPSDPRVPMLAPVAYLSAYRRLARIGSHLRAPMGVPPARRRRAGGSPRVQAGARLASLQIHQSNNAIEAARNLETILPQFPSRGKIVALLTSMSSSCRSRHASRRLTAPW